MSTAAYDFGSPERAGTMPVAGNPHAPPHHHAGTRSPTAVDDPSRDRRGSTASRLTTMSSPDTMRRRRTSFRPERSNTVKTYHEPEHPNWQPGAEPGIDTSAALENLPEHLKDLKAECEIQVIDFSDGALLHQSADNAGLPALLAEPRPDWLPCRWISVNGLSWDVIQYLGNKYSLHRLAIEDLIQPHTRTKVDWYADHAFVVLTLQKLVRLHQHKGQKGKCDCNTMTQLDDDDIDEKVAQNGMPPGTQARTKRWWQLGSKYRQANLLPRYVDGDMDGKIDGFVQAHSGTSESTPIKPIRTLHRYESAQIPEHTAFMEKHSVLADEDLAVSVEQVSIFLLADNTIISFFEHSAEDVEEPLLKRLQSTETMLRRSCDASLMLQALIDAIVDLAMPVKDAYNKARKELQVDAMTSPDIKTSRALHIFGEEIDMLQNLVKPIVHLVNALRDHNTEPLMPAAPVLPPHPENHSDDQAPKKPEGQPPKKQTTKRTRKGAPLYERKLSHFQETALKRTQTATSISITPLAHTYFGDVLDHCITMIQAMEQMDASASNISTLIFNTVGAKTNGFMMILAVVTVFFAPLTFVSGYFGMNFAKGQGLAHSFSFFWVVAVPALVAFMLVVFATMLWDNIQDFFAKRGIRAHRRLRDRGRR